MIAALAVHDQVRHAGDGHTHLPFPAAGGSARVERPCQEARQLKSHGSNMLGDLLGHNFTEQALSLLRTLCQKTRTRVSGQQSIPWQSLGK